MRARRTFCLLLWLSCLLPADSVAQNLSPHKVLGRYQQYVWQDQHGLPQNGVNAITRTRDGYLWLGTCFFNSFDYTPNTRLDAVGFGNNTGAAVRQLRFRIVNITTYPGTPPGYADVRALSVGDNLAVTVGDPAQCSPNPAPCAVAVRGTTLGSQPSQANGGGWNSSLTVGAVTLNAPLAPGAGLNVQFRLGVQQTGSYRFFLNIEALTAAPPAAAVKQPVKKLSAPVVTR